MQGQSLPSWNSRTDTLQINNFGRNWGFIENIMLIETGNMNEQTISGKNKT